MDVQQQGFYAPGDGGDATYQWSLTSYCAGGTSGAPVPADGVICVLPIGQSASTAGRYLFQNPGSVNVLAVGMQPDGVDNGSLVQTLMNAVSAPNNNNSNHTSKIVVPPVLGHSQTNYYFSKPFILARSSIVDCETSNLTGYGGVGLVFAAGMDGVRGESGYLTPDSGWGEGNIRGCNIMSFGYATGIVTPGTGNASSVNFRDDTDIANNTTFAVGDGIVAASRYNQSQIVDDPGATVGSNPSQALFHWRTVRYFTRG